MPADFWPISDLNTKQKKRLQVRVMEVYHFVRARHTGLALRCPCGRLLLKAECVEIFNRLFPRCVCRAAGRSHKAYSSAGSLTFWRRPGSEDAHRGWSGCHRPLDCCPALRPDVEDDVSWTTHEAMLGMSMTSQALQVHFMDGYADIVHLRQRDSPLFTVIVQVVLMQSQSGSRRAHLFVNYEAFSSK